jgi:hypothetical protein
MKYLAELFAPFNILTAILLDPHGPNKQIIGPHFTKFHFGVKLGACEPWELNDLP